MPELRPRWLASLLRNPVSYSGITLFVICTALGLPLLLADLFTSETNPYAAILIYLALPAVAGLGLLIAAYGAWRQSRRPRATPVPFPVLDLNRPHHRVALVSLMAAGIVAFVLLSLTSYQAYNFSDSVQFCGEVCHTVMKPEYTAYQYSPHARVACVACHVGPGAGWFVRSKITGAYQVYSVAFHKYPRPIATPVHSLRPAQATCEQCHWPAKFFGAQQKTFTHYMADEKNSPWQIQTLLKIGGGDPGATPGGGIHWHMNIKNDIYYVASDKEREVIPWVQAVDKQGHAVEYMSTENPMSPADLAKAVHRHMDCVDCHNRPSHIFEAPDRALDRAFATGHLDASLPYLKREGMRLLAADYPTQDKAKETILQALPAFYQTQYPVLYRQKGAAIHEATESLQRIYETNLFPEMKADWRAHPNHIGHLGSDGCFRCHDGLHKSADGRVISNDCNACHTILAQGAPAEVAKMRLQAQTFKHPVDLGGIDLSTMKCSQCHNGTIGL